MTGSALGGGGRSGGRGGGDASGGGGGRGGAGSEATPVSTEIVARWQSALPLKQALMRLRFGAEAATSPQAKEFLDQAENSYIIVVSGPLRRASMRGNPRGIPVDLKAALMTATSLTAKGRDTLKPTDVQITTNETPAEVVLYFPRSVAYTLDDKEVELSTKLGDLAINFKFHLKDMIFNGVPAL